MAYQSNAEIWTLKDKNNKQLALGLKVHVNLFFFSPNSCILTQRVVSTFCCVDFLLRKTFSFLAVDFSHCANVVDLFSLLTTCDFYFYDFFFHPCGFPFLGFFFFCTHLCVSRVRFRWDCHLSFSFHFPRVPFERNTDLWH